MADEDIQWLQDNASTYENAAADTSIADALGVSPEPEPTDRVAEALAAQAEDAPATEDVVVESPMYQKAMAALQRGLPEAIRQSTLDSMSREQVLEVGLGMADGQAEQDRIGSELGRLKKTDSTDSEDADSGATPVEPALDLAKVLEPLDLDLEIFGDDLPKALELVAKAAVNQTRAEMGGELAALRDQLTAMGQDQTGRQLEGRFPQLRDAKNMSEVQRVMREIAPVMEYAEGSSPSEQTSARMERACQVVFGPKASQPGKKNPGARSQPPKPSRASAPVSSNSTQKDKDFAFLRTHEETGGNNAAAMRAYRGD